MMLGRVHQARRPLHSSGRTFVRAFGANVFQAVETGLRRSGRQIVPSQIERAETPPVNNASAGRLDHSPHRCLVGYPHLLCEPFHHQMIANPHLNKLEAISPMHVLPIPAILRDDRHHLALGEIRAERHMRRGRTAWRCFARPGAIPRTIVTTGPPNVRTERKHLDSARWIFSAVCNPRSMNETVERRSNSAGDFRDCFADLLRVFVSIETCRIMQHLQDLLERTLLAHDRAGEAEPRPRNATQLSRRRYHRAI
jgi:hypothetical protein